MMMKGIPESAWNPAISVDITPAKFESLVLAWLRKSAEIEEVQIEAERGGIIRGDGGEYEIDVLVKLRVLGEAVFIVLVECKHLGRPVERKEVMVLEAKLRDVGGHKGFLFSTSGFQSGALIFAEKRGIATVTVTDGKWGFMTRAQGGKSVEPPSWVHFDEYIGVRVRPTEKGVSRQTINFERLDALVECFQQMRGI